MRLDRQLDQVAELAWQILGEVPLKPNDDEELTPVKQQERFFTALLQQRALATVMNLAARKNADPRSVERVLKYFDAGIAYGEDSQIFWRSKKFAMLVALDRADDLDKQLREWIRTDDVTSPWRIMLGMLLAERGQIEEAIRLFETAAKQKLLTAANYRQLADWHLVANQRAEYERAKIEAFKQLAEYQLSRIAYRVRDRWYRTDRPLPTELDEDTLLAYRALFEKSAQPENYLWQLRELYMACRDFRLLQMLPDALLGRSPQQAYSYLQGLRGSILPELRNEATADEILARIKTLREGMRTATDLRASTCSRR